MPDQKLPVQFPFNDMSSGVMTGIKYTLAPPNSVDLSVNFVFDEQIGEAMVRKGTSIIGAQIGGGSAQIMGLHYFIKSSGPANSRLLAVAQVGGNNAIYYFNGTNWIASSLTTDVVGLRTRFETFLNYVVRANGNNAIVTSADGITWAINTTLDDANFPNGKFLKVFKSQMCVAGVTSKPDSLYISSIPNVAGTSISWTVNNREIVFNPNDGQNITGLGVVGGQMMVFKDQSMFRWNNRSTDPEAVVQVGCSSHESIVNCGSGVLAFFNYKGIWLTTGEQPVRISKRIQKWIDGMDPTFYDDVSAYGDSEYLYTSIGDCTVDGQTYSNIVIRYSMDTKEFAVFSYAHKFSVFTKYTVSGLPWIVGGDFTNRVFRIEDPTTYSDNGTAINFIIQSQEMDFGSRGIVKAISERVMGFGINPTKAVVQVLVDNKEWITLGSLSKEINRFLLNQLDKSKNGIIKGNFFRFRVFGSSSNDRFRFQGLEVPHITLLDYAD